MELKEYLKRLRACPDRRLTQEMGLYDNDVTLMKLDFVEAVNHFYSSRPYKFNRLNGGRWIFDFIPGTVRLQVFKGLLSSCGITQVDSRNLEESTWHHDKQEKDYNLTVILHWYQKTRMKGIRPIRTLAIVKEDISRWAMKKNIPLCFPESIGWDYLKSRDYSRIVYFP